MDNGIFYSVINSLTQGILTGTQPCHLAVKLLPPLFNASRSVGFRIFPKQTENGFEEWLHLAAGIPGGEHNTNLKEKLSFHPDVESAAQLKSIVLIEDPRSDPRTGYILDRIIIPRSIHQILYMPYFSRDRVDGVITFDAAKEKKVFADKEVALARFFMRFLSELVTGRKYSMEQGRIWFREDLQEAMTHVPLPQ